MWFKLAGNITALAVAVIMLTALLQASLSGLYALGAHRQAAIGWAFLGQKLGLLWIFVLALPFPKTLPRGNGDALPWMMFILFTSGIFFVCAVLKNRGITLRKIADKAEETLNLQAPLLRAFAAHAGQSAKIGNVSGDGNTVNATNTVTHVLHEAEKQSVTSRLLIGLAISVAAAIINHYFLHLT